MLATVLPSLISTTINLKRFPNPICKPKQVKSTPAFPQHPPTPKRRRRKDREMIISLPWNLHILDDESLGKKKGLRDDYFLPMEPNLKLTSSTCQY